MIDGFAGGDQRHIGSVLQGDRFTDREPCLRSMQMVCRPFAKPEVDGILCRRGSANRPACFEIVGWCHNLNIVDGA